jgi:plasmid stabilization system protein ParE
MKVTRRPIFVSDVEECAAFLCSEAGEEVARRWKSEVERTIALLAAHPELGRIRNDLPIAGVRTIFLRGFPRYLIFYSRGRATIELLRIRHGMMHLPGLFEER